MDLCEIPRWQVLKSQLRNLSPEEFEEIMNRDSSVVLMDVRTMEEVQQFSLEGSIHLDYLSHGFLDQLDKLDRSATYLVYCRTGRRSVRSCILMKNWGFKALYNLDGGLKTWPNTYKQFS